MIQPNFRFIGRGVYSPHEASRLTGVPTARIRRWANGYQFKYRGQRRISPPIIAAQLQGELGMLTLDFADLLEIRFLDAFLERGVSWKAIRIASERARELLHTAHPFSSKRFVTDGHTVLANFASEMGDRVLLDLVRNQYELERLIADCLFGEIDFDEGDTPSFVFWFLGNGLLVNFAVARIVHEAATKTPLSPQRQGNQRRRKSSEECQQVKCVWEIHGAMIRCFSTSSR